MLKGAVGKRYAEALYEIAERDDIVDKIEEELQLINKIIRESKELQKVLYHPQIVAEEKKTVLKNIFEDKISRITVNFLNLLVDHKREVFLNDIVMFFTDFANRARNMVEVHVSSAVELNKEEKKKIKEALGKLTGKRVRATFDVDPSFIGGVTVRIGDRVIDGTIKSKLTNIREHLRQIS